MSEGLPARGLEGRELAPAMSVLAWAVSLISGVAGLVLMAVGLTGHVFGPYHSASAITPASIGAGMLGVAPGLFAAARTELWEHARSLLWPTAVVVVGLFAVSLVDGGALSFHHGSLVPAVFSLGWVAFLGALSIGMVFAVIRQYAEPGLPYVSPPVRLPGWARPLVAILGSAWFGIGAGLLVLPGFWGRFVPWATTRADLHALGVWALALGVGVLGALAEDDLDRVRPAITAVPLIGVLLIVVLLVRGGGIDRHSGGTPALAALVLGLVVTGVVGRVLLGRTRTNGSLDPTPART